MIKFLANVKNHLLIFSALLAFCLLLMLGRFYLTQSLLGGDGVFYYANLRSLVVDGDLNFRNEYEHFHSETSGFTGNRKIAEIPPPHPVTGRLPNRYPIGSTIALLPFFAIGHWVSLLLARLGLPVRTDGYGFIPQLSTGVGSLLYAFMGLMLIYLLGRKLFDSYSFDRFSYNSVTAVTGTLGIWLATPLVYYMTMEPLMSHTVSMFFATAFVLVWYFTRSKPSFPSAIALGGLAGLLIITRYQDVLFLLIPIGEAIVALPNRPARTLLGRKPSPHPLQLLAVTLAVAAGVTSLQLLVNRILYGSFWTTGYGEIGEGPVHWASPYLLPTLFSPAGGLLLWSPILAFAIAGLFLFLRRQVLPASLLLLVLVAQWVLLSVWTAPLGGDSFGGRKFLSCLPIFAIGLMQLLHTLEKRKPLHRAALSLGAVLILANGVLAGLYCFRVIGNPY